VRHPSRYAERLRAAMKSPHNPTGHAVTIRELSLAVGRSYELCRLVLQGQPVGSREFNDGACRYLGLDADDSWRLALREKARRRFGNDAARQAVLPPDNRLLKAWDAMAADDRQRLVRIAEKLAARNSASGRRAKGDDVYTLIILDD
jgi:hypothetical protein